MKDDKKDWVVQALEVVFALLVVLLIACAILIGPPGLRAEPALDTERPHEERKNK